VSEVVQAPRVEVEQRELVLVVERLDDRRADLSGADDEHLHAPGG
jgi:hypothetical protein